MGLEYAVVDNDRLAVTMAETFSDLGLGSMKLLGEASQWGRMQKNPNRAIDFTTTDRFVQAYQGRGYGHLLIALKSHSRWASVHSGFFGKNNPTPKPKHRERYAQWVQAIVERYDGDGVDDMPGLGSARVTYEIGSEFSSYEPEPVAEYLVMLDIARAAAGRADSGTLITHAAFLTTPASLDNADFQRLDELWRDTPMHDRHHDFADMRAVLDRQELFDVINIHNLGDPYELEHMKRWLDWEMQQRGYHKPIIVSDTVPTAYIAWGSATRCKGRGLGVMIPPATEADRCRLARYFKELVSKKAGVVTATRRFVASDHIKRAIIAADQGYAMINLSFTFDLPLLTNPFAQAGAGISAWGGAAKFDLHRGRVLAKYALSYALRQLHGYSPKGRRATRIAAPAGARLYRLGGNWVAWREQERLYIPGDAESGTRTRLSLLPGHYEVTALATTKQPPAKQQVRAATDGLVLQLGQEPVYINRVN